jgi:two-component SAPR family response regulator
VYRIAICGTNNRDLIDLHECLIELIRLSSTQCSIRGYTDYKSIETDGYDLIIIKEDVNTSIGVEAVQYLRDLNSNVNIIYIQNLKDTEEYDNTALDYISLPFKKEIIHENLREIMKIKI